jgi:hypothetical protein
MSVRHRSRAAQRPLYGLPVHLPAEMANSTARVSRRPFDG